MAESSISTYAYISFGLGVLGFILTISGNVFSLIGGIFTGISAIFGILFIKYDYMMVPLITQKTRTVTLSDFGNYELPPAQDVIVKQIGNNYYASSFLGIEIFKSPTEEPREETMKYNEFFERAVSSLRHVTKIAYLIQVEDISKKRQEIELKRADAQAKLSRERQKPLDKEGKQRMAIDAYEKEFEIWDRQLIKISKGRKPMGIVAYGMATAVGVSKDAAISNVRAYAEEVKIAIANSLNVDVKVLSGDELLKCFEWESFFPTSVQDIEAEALMNV